MEVNELPHTIYHGARHRMAEVLSVLWTTVSTFSLRVTAGPDLGVLSPLATIVSALPPIK